MQRATADELDDALQQLAMSSLRGSPGARAYYDALRARKISHQSALRRLANRHVGILHSQPPELITSGGGRWRARGPCRACR